jgi:hypothetical protein
MEMGAEKSGVGDASFSAISRLDGRTTLILRDVIDRDGFAIIPLDLAIT